MSDDLGNLLQEVANGDKQAFAQLYDATAPQVYGLCLHILRSAAVAEDVTQEVYISVWRSAASFDPQKGTAKTWVLKIARHRAIDQLRSHLARLNREEKEAALSQLLHFSDVEHEALTAVEGAQVRQALDMMGEPHRTALLYCYFGGLSHSELAEATGVALGTAKTRVRDGLKKLRSHLARKEQR